MFLPLLCIFAFLFLLFAFHKLWHAPNNSNNFPLDLNVVWSSVDGFRLTICRFQANVVWLGKKFFQRDLLLPLKPNCYHFSFLSEPQFLAIYHYDGGYIPLLPIYPSYKLPLKWNLSGIP